MALVDGDLVARAIKQEGGDAICTQRATTQIAANLVTGVLQRDQYTCQMCGYALGEWDPLDRRRKIRMTIRFITDGPAEADNLRAVCTNCYDGLQGVAPPKPDRLQLMRQLRRATIADQMHALEWLERKFNKGGVPSDNPSEGRVQEN